MQIEKSFKHIINASSGLPNTFGGYDETPEVTAKHLKVWNILSVNIVVL